MHLRHALLWGFTMTWWNLCIQLMWHLLIWVDKCACWCVNQLREWFNFSNMIILVGRCDDFHQEWHTQYRADSWFAPSQWETSLQSNDVSHWLGTNLESALNYAYIVHSVVICCALLWFGISQFHPYPSRVLDKHRGNHSRSTVEATLKRMDKYNSQITMHFLYYPNKNCVIT